LHGLQKRLRDFGFLVRIVYFIHENILFIVLKYLLAVPSLPCRISRPEPIWLYSQ